MSTLHDRPSGTNGRAAASPPASDEPRSSFDALVARFGEIAEHLTRISRARAARWRVRLLQTVVLVAMAVVGGVVAVACGIAGVALVAVGLPEVLTTDLGLSPGVAALASGAVLLAAPIAFLLLALRAGRRRVLRELAEEREEGSRETKPRTALQRIEREERREREALQASLAAAGEELCEATRVRELVRRHPLVAVGASAALGAFLAPYAAGALEKAGPSLLRAAKRFGLGKA